MNKNAENVNTKIKPGCKKMWSIFTLIIIKIRLSAEYYDNSFEISDWGETSKPILYASNINLYNKLMEPCSK